MDIVTPLQQQAEAIVRQGKAVREGIAKAVAAAAKGAGTVTDGFVGLARTTLHGAAMGVADAAPAESARTLRAVVDGIGDGLAVVAQAAKLTLHEAAGSAVQFAREDMDKLADGFCSLADSFVDTVGSAAMRAGGQAADQATTLREHAAITLGRTRPMLQAAIDAARRDLPGLSRQSLTAAAGATRGGLGALFTAVGEKLQNLGAHLSPPNDAGAKGT